MSKYPLPVLRLQSLQSIGIPECIKQPFFKVSESLGRQITILSKDISQQAVYLSQQVKAAAHYAQTEGPRVVQLAQDTGFRAYNGAKEYFDKKIVEFTPKVQQFIQENPNEVSTGAAIVGGITAVDGAYRLAKGNKALGLAELFFSTISFTVAGYIQKNTIINPLVSYVKPMISEIPNAAQNTRKWIDTSFISNPEISTISGAAGGALALLGVRDILNGNVKLGAFELVSGAVTVAASIYGLSVLRQQGICVDS